LPRVVDALLQADLKTRIRVIAAGKLVTSARAAWALCVGADFVNTARGFMFALGCIQALRCHTNTCPTGVTTHNKRLQRGLVVEEKYVRIANYVNNMNKEIDMIAQSCGCRHARELKREYVCIVQSANHSIALNMLISIRRWSDRRSNPRRARSRSDPREAGAAAEADSCRNRSSTSMTGDSRSILRSIALDIVVNPPRPSHITVITPVERHANTEYPGEIPHLTALPQYECSPSRTESAVTLPRTTR
jgi:hypothetical protein